MTDAERILDSVHAAGYTMVTVCEVATYHFPDATDAPLPEWLRAEMLAHVRDLAELCHDFPCMRCGRPDVAPAEGLTCAECDGRGPLGQMRRIDA